MQLHDMAIAQYGGALGVLDFNALQSALAQPQTHVFGMERFDSICKKAAAYCFFLTCAHAFADGNKRVGVLAAIHFLITRGIIPKFDPNIAYAKIVATASGLIREPDELFSLFCD